MNGNLFLDASFWIAYRDTGQPAHASARRIVGELARVRPRLVTTLPVVCEIQAYFSRDRRKNELLLRDIFNNPVVVIEDILAEDRNGAIEILQTHRDKSYSLCDVLSFMVMRRLRLRRALTFDDHFRQFGEFEILG